MFQQIYKNKLILFNKIYATSNHIIQILNTHIYINAWIYFLSLILNPIGTISRTKGGEKFKSGNWFQSWPIYVHMYTSLHICHDVNGFQKRQLYHGNFWPNFFRFKQKIVNPQEEERRLIIFQKNICKATYKKQIRRWLP